MAAFLRNRTDLWLSVVVLHELEYGARLLPPGARPLSFDACKAFMSKYCNQ